MEPVCNHYALDSCSWKERLNFLAACPPQKKEMFMSFYTLV